MKLKSINKQLANRVELAALLCFSKGQRFYVSTDDRIPPSGGFLGLAKLHAFDMEKGASHVRGLDNRRKNEKNHPGRLVIDLITDMLKEEMINSDIKTYQVLLKLACSTNKILAKFDLTAHVATTAENKISRDSGGNCWDHAHVALRIAKSLGIPVKRHNKGVHMFLVYQFKSKANQNMYFGFDPLFCKSQRDCPHEFFNSKMKRIASSDNRTFFNKAMKKEKCYANTMKNDPSKLLFFK